MDLPPIQIVRRILLVGQGRMGSSLLAAWRRDWPEVQVSVVSKSGQTPPFGRGLATRDSTQPDAFDAVVLAVKPADVAGALRELSGLPGAPLLISVAAGVSLPQLKAGCRPTWRCVRAMSSLAISVGGGAAVAVGENLGVEDIALCERLLSVSGGVEWIAETAMDAATALMGSGPAYFFRLAEALVEAGEALGLEPRLAAHLTRATLAGAGALAAAGDEPLTQLKGAVASPGGTTAAALGVLDRESALDRLVSSAVDAATRRGAELRGGGPVATPR